MRLSGWCCAALIAAAVPGCKKKSNEPADQSAAKTATPERTGSAAMAPGSAAMATGSAAPAETPKAATPEDMAKRYAECWGFWNAKDFTSMATCYAPNITSEQVDSGMPPLTAPEAIIGYHQAIATAFPDRKGDVEVTLVNGHNAATFALLTGTNSGPMKTPTGEMPATNKKIGMQVAHAVHFTDDGKAADKEWFYQDMGEMMGQLGVAKAPVRAAVDKPWHDNEVVIAKDDDTEKKNLGVAKQMMDSFNSRDMKALDAALDDKIVWSEQGIAKDWNGKAEAVKAHQSLIKAFSDVKFASDNAWAAGDYVVAQGTMTGTNDGPAPDMGLAKPTKKPISIRFMQLFKIKDGKIVNSWGYWNSAAMAQQLGLTPPQGGAKAGETKPADKPAKK